jgi:hypothetical protein
MIQQQRRKWRPVAKTCGFVQHPGRRRCISEERFRFLLLCPVFSGMSIITAALAALIHGFGLKRAGGRLFQGFRAWLACFGGLALPDLA